MKSYPAEMASVFILWNNPEISAEILPVGLPFW
jgi:hypothetical protein